MGTRLSEVGGLGLERTISCGRRTRVRVSSASPPICGPHSVPLHSAKSPPTWGTVPHPRSRGRVSPCRERGLMRAPLFPGASVYPICTQGRGPDLSPGDPGRVRPAVSGASVPEPRKGVPRLPGPPPQFVTYLPPHSRRQRRHQPLSVPRRPKPVLEARQSERLNLRPLPPGLQSPDAEPPLSERLPVTAGRDWCAAPSSGPVPGELVSSALGQEAEDFRPFVSVS